MSYLAPAGTPVSLRDVANAVRAKAGPALESLVGTLQSVSGLPVAIPVSSGRAAMTLILRAMRRVRNDVAFNEVIVPAYTCYSVPAAIERAGLKPRLCDVDPGTLGMDPTALARCDFSRTLTVVSANLYGLPNDLAAIESVCRERGVFLLDDAAQALGARLGGRAVGSFGDAGLYSFDKGKVISTIQGGSIAARSGALASAIDELVEDLPASSLADSAVNLAKLVAYAVFLEPDRYDFIQGLPFTGLGDTAYEPKYPIARLAGFQMALAATLMKRLPALMAGRQEQARGIEAALRNLPGLIQVAPQPGAVPAWVRYPIRVRNPDRRARILKALDRAGIGATASYPRALPDVPEVAARLSVGNQDMPGAREVASSIVTLPTHAYCPPDLGSRIRTVIRSCLN